MYVLPVICIAIIYILEFVFLLDNHNLNADNRNKLESLPAVEELSAILNPPRFDANFTHLQSRLIWWVETHDDWPFAASDNTRFSTPFNFRNFLSTFEHFSLTSGRFEEMRNILDEDLLGYLLSIARRCRTLDVARAFISFQALLKLRTSTFDLTNIALQTANAGNNFSNILSTLCENR